MWLVGLIIGIIIGMWVVSNRKPQSAEKKSPARGYEGREEAEWLDIVRNTNCYEKKPLLNGEERRIYWPLIHICREHGLSVHAQACMGQYISTPHEFKEEHSAVNSLRADFCITKKNMIPVGIVEYNGGLHEGKTDARKIAAIEKVGMFYHGVTESDLKNNIDKHLREKLLPKIKKNTG